jgi:penicillin-binding protein 1C
MALRVPGGRASQYGTYRPRNFDGDWTGLVTLRDALSRSLNLPFVDLLDRLGVETFVSELSRMGVSQLRTAPGQYGLSMIVGGIELTPLEIAGMYATLAEDGAYRPLRMPGRPRCRRRAIHRGSSAGAAWLTRQALARDRPASRAGATRGGPPHPLEDRHESVSRRVAVGSAGLHGRGVDGNVDNQPSAELIGSEAAGPLLFDVLEGLAGRAAAGPQPPPDDLIDVEVCAYSGHIAGDACFDRVTVRAPIHAVPTAPCPYHQAYEVDHATGRAVLPSCRKAQRSYDRKSFVVLPSPVVAWLTARHRSVPSPGVRYDDCAADASPTPPPAIVTPGEDRSGPDPRRPEAAARAADRVDPQRG